MTRRATVIKFEFILPGDSPNRESPFLFSAYTRRNSFAKMISQSLIPFPTDKRIFS
jgi:hypothetical protein